MSISLGKYTVPKRYIPVGLTAVDSLLQKKYRYISNLSWQSCSRSHSTNKTAEMDTHADARSEFVCIIPDGGRYRAASEQGINN